MTIEFKQLPQPAKVAKASQVEVLVHPLVLLSVVDHYNRVAKNTSKRVVGVLLGYESEPGKMHIANSFGIPFEEEQEAGGSQATVWYLDHNYLESMEHMFRKITGTNPILFELCSVAKEKIVGWYSTAPTLNSSDISIHHLITKYVHPSSFGNILVLVHLDATHREKCPTDAFVLKQIIHDDGTPPTQSFHHIPSSTFSSEPEEIGVDHLLRNTKYNSLSSQLLDKVLQSKVDALDSLREKLQLMNQYLVDVSQNKLRPDQRLLSKFQLLLSQEVGSPFSWEALELNHTEVKPLDAAHHADMMSEQFLLLYLGSLARCVSSVHDAVTNWEESVLGKAPEKSEKKEIEKEASKAKA